MDAHNQHFLRGDNNNVSCVAISPSVRAVPPPLLQCQAGAPVVPQSALSVTVVCLCIQGRLIASGHSGENADVYVWDYSNRERLYRSVPRSPSSHRWCYTY